MRLKLVMSWTHAHVSDDMPRHFKGIDACGVLGLGTSGVKRTAALHRRYFPTILIVLLAVFNDGAMIALSKDRVRASPLPDTWSLRNIFVSGGGVFLLACHLVGAWACMSCLDLPVCHYSASCCCRLCCLNRFSCTRAALQCIQS